MSCSNGPGSVSTTPPGTVPTTAWRTSSCDRRWCTPRLSRAVLDGKAVHAIAHITGGGLPGNLERVLPPGADAVVDRGAWQEPPVFAEIRRLGDVEEQEMARVFNLGIGMVLVVDDADAAGVVGALGAAGRDAVVLGAVTEGTGGVQLTGTAPRP